MRGRAVRQEMAAQNDAAVAVQAAMRGKQARSQQQAMAEHAAEAESAAALLQQWASEESAAVDGASAAALLQQWAAEETADAAVTEPTPVEAGPEDNAATAVQAALRGRAVRQEMAAQNDAAVA
eukprot:5803483-Prymnesium_polylepis.1